MSKGKKLTEGGGGEEGGNGEKFLNCNPTKLLKKLDFSITILPAAAASFFVACSLGT